MTPAGLRMDIQGVRGLALLLMLGAHAELPFLHGGFVGLELFYVLSGYLITGLIVEEVRRHGRVSLLRFYARRARRLLPLAATVLGVTLVGAVLLFGSLRAYHVAQDVIAAALYYSNWHFIANSVDYFQFDDPTVSPVQHFWSLSFEEQFYVTWPLVVVAALWLARRGGVRPKALLWAAVGLLGLASFGYGLWFSPHDPQEAYFSSLTRVWEIGVGVALALALPRWIHLSRRASALIAAGGLAVILATAVLYEPGIPYPGWRALLPTLATAAIIVAGTSTVVSQPIRLLCARPLQHAGRVSYAWYLWHWPALAFAAELFDGLTPLGRAAVTAFAWIPTVISHHLIEERFRRSPALARRPRRSVGVGLGFTAAAVLLALVLAGVEPTVPTARGAVAGADAMSKEKRKHRRVQRSARAIRPNPRDAEKDREAPYAHCHVKEGIARPSPGRACVFGDPRSRTTVVNLGDSHALMHFPAVAGVARRRGWRLVNLTHAGCVTADVDYNDNCDPWRESALRRIERERPQLVVVSTATDGGQTNPSRYAVKHDGHRLSRGQSEAYLEMGFARTLRRLQATGARVVLIRDIAWAPKGIVQCVADHLHHLRRCAFRRHRKARLAFDVKAAREVPGVKIVDPLRIICLRRVCPAVIGDALVYRNQYHITATFSATMTRWLAKRLPKHP
jgi:peptidoglycan/LPS O-acetylase OafA/YrhL